MRICAFGVEVAKCPICAGSVDELLVLVRSHEWRKGADRSLISVVLRRAPCRLSRDLSISPSRELWHGFCVSFRDTKCAGRRLCVSVSDLSRVNDGPQAVGVDYDIEAGGRK